MKSATATPEAVTTASTVTTLTVNPEGYSFDGFVWPKAPDPLQPTPDNPEPPAPPASSGPGFDPQIDAAYVAAVEAATADHDAAAAAAEQANQQAGDAADQAYDTAYLIAVVQRDDALAAAQAVFDEAMSQSLPAALLAPLAEKQAQLMDVHMAYVTASEAAEDAWESSLMQAWQDYQDATGSGTTTADQINAWYNYTVARITADNAHYHVQIPLEYTYLAEALSLQGSISLLAGQAAAWDVAHPAQAEQDLLVARAQIEETFATAVAAAEQSRSDAKAQGQYDQVVAVADADLMLAQARAEARTTAAAGWASTTGTPWAAHLANLFQLQGEYDTAATDAQRDWTTASAAGQLLQQQQDAAAKAVQDIASAAATRHNVEDRAAAAMAHITTALGADSVRRQAEVDALQAVLPVWGEAVTTFGTVALAEWTATSLTIAPAQRDYDLLAASLWQTYSGDYASYQAAVDSAYQDYILVAAGVLRDYGLTRVDAQSEFTETMVEADLPYRASLWAAYATWATAVGSAPALEVARVAKADADADVVRANAAAGYAVAVANHAHTYALTDAAAQAAYTVAEATQQRLLSLNEAAAGASFSTALATTHATQLADWAAALDTPWAHYREALSVAQQSYAVAAANADVAQAQTAADALFLQATTGAAADQTLRQAEAAINRDEAIAFANAQRVAAVATAAAPFQAVAPGSDLSTLVLTADVAHQFVNAFGPASGPGSPAMPPDWPSWASLYQGLYTALDLAAREWGYALVNAWYAYETGALDQTAYEAAVQAANAAYNAAVTAGIPTGSDSDPLPPLTSPPPWTESDQHRINAAACVIQAEAQRWKSEAQAVEQADASAASAFNTWQQATNAETQAAGSTRAAARLTYEQSVAAAARDEKLSDAAAKATYEQDYWASYQLTATAQLNAEPTPLNQFLADAATVEVSWTSAKGAADLAYAQAIATADFQQGQTTASLVYAETISNLATELDRADALASATQAHTVAVAQAVRTQADADADATASYRQALAAAITDFQILAASAGQHYHAAVGDGVASEDARLTYVQTLGEFYVTYIEQLAQGDLAYTTSLAGNEYVETLAELAAGSAYHAAQRDADGLARTATEDAAYARAVAEAQAQTSWVAAHAAAETTSAQMVGPVKVTHSAGLAESQAAYALATAQEEAVALAAASDTSLPAAFEVATADAQVSWLQAVTPQYLTYVTQLAQALTDQDLALAQADADERNSVQAAQHVADLAHAAVARTFALAEGTAEDNSQAGADARLGEYAQALALDRKTALVQSAGARADHAVALAAAWRAYHLGAAQAAPLDDIAEAEQLDAVGLALRTQQAQAELDLATGLGDAAVAWATSIGDAGLVVQSAEATALSNEASALALIFQSQAAADAAADDTAALAQGTAVAHRWTAAATAAAAREVAESTAANTFTLAQYSQTSVSTGQLVTTFLQAHPDVPADVQSWLEFLTARTQAESFWAQATSSAALAFAANVAQTRVTYTGAVASAYQTWVQDSASAAQALTNQMAATRLNAEAGTDQAHGAYLVAVATAERAYRIDVAGTERQYTVALAQANLDPGYLQDGWSEAYSDAVAAAESAHAAGLEANRQGYATLEQDAFATQVAAITDAARDATTLMGNALIAWTTTAGSAVQAFTQAEADRDYDRLVAVAALDQAFADLALTGFADAMTALTTSQPSYWADQEASLASMTAQQLVAAAQDDLTDRTAAAATDRDEAISLAQQQTADSLALASARKVQALADLDTLDQLLSGLLAAREDQLQGGTSDAPVLGPSDAPLLADAGQAEAQLAEETILANEPPQGPGAEPPSYPLYLFAGYDYNPIYSIYGWSEQFGYYTGGLRLYLPPGGLYAAGDLGPWTITGVVEQPPFVPRGLDALTAAVPEAVYEVATAAEAFAPSVGQPIDNVELFEQLPAGLDSGPGSPESAALLAQVVLDTTTQAALTAGDRPALSSWDELAAAPAPGLVEIGAGNALAEVGFQVADARKYAGTYKEPPPPPPNLGLEPNKKAAAKAETPKNARQWLDKFFRDAKADPLEFGRQYGSGVVLGFLKDGLWSNVELIQDAPGMVKRAFLAGIEAAKWVKDKAIQPVQTYEELKQTVQQLYDVHKELSQAAVQFSNLTPEQWGFLLRGETEKLDGQVSDLLLTAIDTTHDLASQLGSKLLEVEAKDAAHLYGRLSGLITYQVAETLALAALGPAVAKKLVDAPRLAKVLKNLPGLKGNAAFAQAVDEAVAKLTVRLATLLDTKICFVAGTKVHTVKGLVNIEVVRRGDIVLTRPEGDIAGKSAPVYKRVLQTITTHPDELFHVRFRTEDGREEELVSTGGHPFYVLERAAFVPAFELKPGDGLALPEGRTARVVVIKREVARGGQSFTTYNLEVEDCHTYFAGRAGVWVHNTGPHPCQRMAGLFEKYTDTAGNYKYSEEVAFGEVRRWLENQADMPAVEKAKHLEDALRELKAKGKLPESFSPQTLTPLRPMERSDMPFHWHTDGQGRPVRWYGQSRWSSSKGQHEAAAQQATLMIRSGEYDSIVTQRSVRRATGLDELGRDTGSVGRLEPDIIGLRRDGTVDIFEVVSDSQNTPAGINALETKLRRIRAALPSERRGQIKVINPFE